MGPHKCPSQSFVEYRNNAYNEELGIVKTISEGSLSGHCGHAGRDIYSLEINYQAQQMETIFAKRRTVVG